MYSGDSLRHKHQLGTFDVCARSDRLSVLWAINAKRDTRGTHFLWTAGTQAYIPHLCIPEEPLNHARGLCKQGCLIEQPK